MTVWRQVSKSRRTSLTPELKAEVEVFGCRKFRLLDPRAGGVDVPPPTVEHHRSAALSEGARLFERGCNDHLALPIDVPPRVGVFANRSQPLPKMSGLDKLGIDDKRFGLIDVSPSVADLDGGVVLRKCFALFEQAALTELIVFLNFVLQTGCAYGARRYG